MLTNKFTLLNQINQSQSGMKTIQLNLEANPVVMHRLKLNGITLNNSFERQESNVSNSSSSEPGSATKRKSSLLPSFARLRQLAMGKKVADDPKTPRPMVRRASTFSTAAFVPPFQELPKKDDYTCPKLKQFQKWLYIAMEEPNSSLIARIIFLLVFLGILFTIFDTIVETAVATEIPHQLTYVELAISICFIVEFFLRLVSSTAFGEPLIRFFMKTYNIIDLIAIVPFFVELATEDMGIKSLRVIRMIRLVRIARIFKMSRYITGTLTFIDGLRKSLASLGFLIFLVFFLDATFATAFYYAEAGSFWETLDESSSRTIGSLTEAMWFTMVTLSSVGYGDLTPQTILGRCIAGLFAVVGMLMFAIPVAVLGNNFQDAYTKQLEHEKIEAYKEEKFKDAQELTDAQREMRFMTERIQSIDETNDKIMELLQNSKKIYNGVARDIKHLYKSIYADEDFEDHKESKVSKDDNKSLQPEEPRSSLLSSLSGSKMSNRIQVMEKLAKARQKIKITNLFRFAAPRKSQGGDESMADGSVGDLDGTPSRRGKRPSTKGTVTFTSPLKRLATRTLNREGLVSENFVDEDEDGDGEMKNIVPISAFENDLSFKDTYSESLLAFLRQNPDFRSGRNSPRELPDRKNRKRNRTQFRIKSNSVGNENELVKYYNEKLDFLSNSILQELLFSKNNHSFEGEQEAGEGSGSPDNMNQSGKPNESKLIDSTPRIYVGRTPRPRKETRQNSIAIVPRSKSRENSSKKEQKQVRVIDAAARRKMRLEGRESQEWYRAASVLEEKEKQRKSKSFLQKTPDISFDNSLQLQKPQSYRDMKNKALGYSEKTSRKLLIDETTPSGHDESVIISPDSSISHLKKDYC